jgi:hypothetical protein
MPWSIRQTAVYHSLDVVTGNAFWIIMKGDELIKERIEAATEPSGMSIQLDDPNFQGSPFTASLATHMIICDWCSESWRWYISYLEETLREKTKYFFAVKVQPKQRPNGSTRPRQGYPPEASGLRSRFNTMPTHSPLTNQNKFSFTNFLEVQTAEDRANEVHLILESNISILTKLQEHYNEVILSENCPKNLICDCKMQIERFEKRINGIINDLQMQQSRTTNLLRLIADRKNLVCSEPPNLFPTRKLIYFIAVRNSPVSGNRGQQDSCPQSSRVYRKHGVDDEGHAHSGTQDEVGNSIYAYHYSGHPLLFTWDLYFCKSACTRPFAA